MKRTRRWARLPAIAVLMLVIPAVASAPSDQYAPFNTADVTITDSQTGLTWERAVSTRASFSFHASRCDALPPYYVGQKWRLPSVKELLTLVDERKHQEYEGDRLVDKWIDVNAFPATPSTGFWTSSASADGSGKYWTVDFGDGTSQKQDPNATFYARCVTQLK